MRLLFILFASVVGGLSENDIILANETGVPIARITIGNRTLEGFGPGSTTDKILIAVTPTKHHLHIVFRGGADVDWPKFDFQGVHEIFLERHHNKIAARIE